MHATLSQAWYPRLRRTEGSPSVAMTFELPRVIPGINLTVVAGLGRQRGAASIPGSLGDDNDGSNPRPYGHWGAYILVRISITEVMWGIQMHCGHPQSRTPQSVLHTQVYTESVAPPNRHLETLSQRVTPSPPSPTLRPPYTRSADLIRRTAS